MALYDDKSFLGLRDRFGLRPSGASPLLPEGTSAIGKSYLNSADGSRAAYTLFNDQAKVDQHQGLTRAFDTVYTNYKAAAALKPDLQFTDFLSEVDPSSIYHSMSFFDRGERPSAFTGKYKYVSA